MNPMQADLYPSRQEDQPSWQERLDPVVYRSDLENAPIAAELVERFERDGYLVIPNLFSADEVALFRAELERMRQDPAVAGSGKTIKEPDSGAIRSVFAIHKDNELFARVAADERTAGIARFILGGDLYVHQSRMNFKPGFTGKEFYWHSDFETWHIEDGMPRMRCLSCSILLTDNEPHNGPLMLMPGSHKHYVRCVEPHRKITTRSPCASEIGIPDQNSLSELASRFGIDCATGPPAAWCSSTATPCTAQRQHHAQRAEQSVLRLQPRG